jgi:hypothetical protein
LAAILKAVSGWEERGLSGASLESATLAELFEASANDDRVRYLVLPDLESGRSADEQEALAAELIAWADLCGTRKPACGEATGLRLLCLVSPMFPLMHEEPHLSTRHWWAQTDAVDNQVIFADLAESHGLDESRLADYWWLKALCQGFCHDDFILMSLILERGPRTMADIIQTLARHPLHPAAQRFRQPVAAQPVLQPLRMGERPPLPSSGLYRELWSEGLLLITPTSILHPLLMDEEALSKAIGASQRQVFLPLVDYMLSFLLGALEAYFDPYVWSQYEPDEERRSALITEISPLAFFITNKLPLTAHFDEDAKMTSTVFAHCWRKIRNTVAHNKIIKYEDLYEAFKVYNVYFDLTSKYLVNKRQNP